MSASQINKRGGIASLWYNKETRGVIMQILTVAIVFGFGAWIFSNATANLELIGKDISLDFLGQVAGYQLSDTWVTWNTQTSTHGDVIWVGIVNTLRVAFFGIILATLLGFFVGVLRLSKNWLVSRVASIYVETLRNVPVLLWILLMHGIIISTLPETKDLRSGYRTAVAEAIEAGADKTEAAALGHDAIGALGGTVFNTNRGLFMPKPLPEYPLFWLTLIALAGGIAYTIWYKKRAMAVQEKTGQTLPVLRNSLLAILAAPLLVFLVTGMPLSWETPQLKGFNFQGGMAIRPEFMALTLALAVYTSAFIAEIVRAGIQSVNHGQSEAAAALGLRTSRALQLVIIPQALRVIIPPLTSQFLNLTKNSSLAIAVGFMDIVATIGGISLNQTGREMESMTIVLSIYLVISLLISAFMNWYNKRMKLVER